MILELLVCCFSTGIDMVLLLNTLVVLLVVEFNFFIFCLRLAFRVFRAFPKLKKNQHINVTKQYENRLTSGCIGS